MSKNLKRAISMLLAVVMVLSLLAVPGVFAIGVRADEAGPVALKFHYSREDGAYDDWDLFSWGAITGAAAFEEDNGEMVATIYAAANTSSVGSTPNSQMVLLRAIRSALWKSRMVSSRSRNKNSIMRFFSLRSRWRSGQTRGWTGFHHGHWHQSLRLR